MNASTQEMFESVRAVVAGRLRDEHQIRDLAERVAESSTAVRRRVDRAVGYARSGLRLEASAEADADPSVFEMSAGFDTDEFKQWIAYCNKNKLPNPDHIAPEAILEIEEATALLAPLRSRLAQMRRLVLADASAWHRLETLRELIQRDPDNPAWEEDRKALEPYTADELGERFEDGMRRGDLEDAEACVAHMQDGKWHWHGVSKIAATLRARLDRELAARTIEVARAAADRLDAEWAAENEEGARQGLDEWRGIEERLLSFGGEMPGELVGRIDAVESWLGGRERTAEDLRTHRDRVAALERVATDESSTLAQVRAALRAAEQTVEGVPADVRAIAERRIDEFERRTRTRRLVLVGSVVVLLLAGATVAFIAVQRNTESNRIQGIADAASARVREGQLDEAEKVLAAAESDAAVAADPRIAEARAALAAARTPLELADRRFAAAVEEAGDPESPEARPDRMEEARSAAHTAEQQKAVVEWTRKYTLATAVRRAERVQAAVARSKEVAAQVTAAEPNADASWEGNFAKWESALADIERSDGALEEVRAEIERGRTLLVTQRTKAANARAAVERASKVAGLGLAATSPGGLATALEAFVQANPGSPEAKDFALAIAARPSWEALVAFRAINPKEGANLATATQAERTAMATALDGYLKAHPTTPFKAQVQQARALLGNVAEAAPAWRAWILEKIATLDDFGLYMLERRDGTRVYSKQDPRKVPWQNSGGAVWKSVMCLTGKGGKEAFERFDQAQLKSEGPSPQVALGKSMRDLLDNEAKCPNSVEAALAALALLREDETVDGAFLATIARGLLESMGPDMPALLQLPVEVAARRIAALRPDEIEWTDPRDADARNRSRNARTMLRELVQPEAWRKTYQAAFASATDPFLNAYQPAGVLVKPGGAAAVLPVGGVALEPGTVLSYVDPPLGDHAASLVRLGVVGANGSVAFEAVADSVPAGTMVFTAKRGPA